MEINEIIAELQILTGFGIDSYSAALEAETNTKISYGRLVAGLYHEQGSVAKSELLAKEHKEYGDKKKATARVLAVKTRISFLEKLLSAEQSMMKLAKHQ